jgi:hypothetical protein
MIDFEFESALQAFSGIAESLDAAGVDSGVPSHEDHLPSTVGDGSEDGARF